MSGHWIKFYPSDWLTGTIGLTAAEKGVYITILALIYDKGGPIPNNQKVLARRCEMTPAAFRDALSTLVSEGKLTVSADEIFNKKAEKIIEAAHQRIEKARKGGLAKANGKTEGNQTSDFTQAESKQPASNARDVPDGYLAPAKLGLGLEEEKKASKLAQKASVEGKPEPADNGLEADLRHAANWFHDAPRLSHVKPIADLIAQGLSLHDDVIPTVRQLAPQADFKTSWNYFVGPLEDILRRRKTAQNPEPKADTPKTGPASVWVWKGSPQWEAWSKNRTRPWPTKDQRHPDGGMRPGWYFPSEWPATGSGADPPSQAA